jgi:hypothetical protein
MFIIFSRFTLLTVFIMICATVFPSALWAEVFAKSGPSRVSLLEVYSSEGCSSCPPADEWVRRLRETSGLWRDFVPVIFHVDYWNYLGWQDQFATSQFSARQRAYADTWGNGHVYTPGFVLNGQEWRDWRQHSVPLLDNKPAGVLLLEKGEQYLLEVTFQPLKDKDDLHSCDVYLAVLGFDLRSDVQRGENQGKQLKHDFVVLGYVRQTMEFSADGTFQTKIPLTRPEDSARQKLGIVVWVTRSNNLEPLQAAGGYL